MWIARDTTEERLVSLKVWRADESHSAYRERDMINHLLTSFPSQVADGAIPEVIHDLMIHGKYFWRLNHFKAHQAVTNV